MFIAEIGKLGWIQIRGVINSGPSSNCEMIILRNNSHGEIICFRSLYGNIYDCS